MSETEQIEDLMQSLYDQEQQLEKAVASLKWIMKRCRQYSKANLSCFAEAKKTLIEMGYKDVLDFSSTDITA